MYMDFSVLCCVSKSRLDKSVELHTNKFMKDEVVKTCINESTEVPNARLCSVLQKETNAHGIS